MKKTVTVCALAIFALALASAPSALAADGWIGTWKLNLAKSKFKPGPAPKSQTLKFEPTTDGIKLTTDSVGADGKATSGGYTAKFDGTETSFSGNPNADSAAPKRVDANHYVNTWKKDGKVTVTTDVTVSKDGKSLTVVQTGKTAKGEVMDTVEVFEKQ